MGSFCALIALQYSAGSRDSAQFQSMQKDTREHRTIETAGIRIAKGWVIAAEEGNAVGQMVFSTVREGECGATLDDSLPEEMCEVAVPGDFSEADDDANFGEGGDLCAEVGGAVTNLLWGGLVAGWSATDDGANPELAELEAIVSADGDGLAGQPELVQDGIHEVAGAVAGEGAAGAVGTVGSGGEAEDEDAGVGVAETRNGFGPVLLVAVGLAAVFADGAAVVDEPGAAGAGGDALLSGIENGEKVVCCRPPGVHWGLFLGSG